MSLIFLARARAGQVVSGRAPEAAVSRSPRVVPLTFAEVERRRRQRTAPVQAHEPVVVRSAGTCGRLARAGQVDLMNASGRQRGCGGNARCRNSASSSSSRSRGTRTARDRTRRKTPFSNRHQRTRWTGLSPASPDPRSTAPRQIVGDDQHVRKLHADAGIRARSATYPAANVQQIVVSDPSKAIGWRSPVGRRCRSDRNHSRPGITLVI